VADAFRRLAPANSGSGDVAAEGDERLDGVRHEARRLDRAREGVGACRRRRGRPVRPDLGLDQTAVAVVDRTKQCDRSTVEPGMADVQLASRCRPESSGLAHLRASATACAIVLASVTENVATATPGRLTTTTAGSGSTPVFATSAETARSLDALSGTNAA